MSRDSRQNEKLISNLGIGVGQKIMKILEAH